MDKRHSLVCSNLLTSCSSLVIGFGKSGPSLDSKELVESQIRASPNMASLTMQKVSSVLRAHLIPHSETSVISAGTPVAGTTERIDGVPTQSGPRHAR